MPTVPAARYFARGAAFLLTLWLATTFAIIPVFSQTKPASEPAVPGALYDREKSCEDSRPLPPEHIAGKWTDAKSKKKFEITQPDPKSAAKFLGHGEFEWDGSFQGGKLTFRHSPKATEMNPEMPPWAAKSVEGQLLWSIELEPQLRCGTPTLKGKWHPGAVKIVEEFDDNGRAIRQEASLDNASEEVIDVEFRIEVVSHVYLFAKGVFHTFLVDKLYQDVPTFVGVAFEEPYAGAEYPVSIELGGARLDLVAKPADAKRRFFQTDVFMVTPP